MEVVVILRLLAPVQMRHPPFCGENIRILRAKQIVPTKEDKRVVPVCFVTIQNITKEEKG